jgi:DNA ligase-associated metallophosphoesterase
VADVSFSFAGQRFVPLGCGALFWPARATLLVADLHLEKGAAMARRGWMVPPHDSLVTLARLARAIGLTGARRVVALGDSFHDGVGPAAMGAAGRARLAEVMGLVEWLWIEGNHDGASPALLGGRAYPELVEEGICLRHEALPHDSRPEISGHYHPCVKIRARAGVSIRRRCIAISGKRMVLPAYGAYAGGLAVEDPALARALGGQPDALLAVAGRVLRLAPRDGHSRSMVMRFIGDSSLSERVAE